MFSSTPLCCTHSLINTHTHTYTHTQTHTHTITHTRRRPMARTHLVLLAAGAHAGPQVLEDDAQQALPTLRGAHGVRLIQHDAAHRQAQQQLQAPRLRAPPWRGVCWCACECMCVCLCVYVCMCVRTFLGGIL